MKDRELLFSDNQQWAIGVARKFARKVRVRRLSDAEIRNAALIALWSASLTWRAARGTEFHSFAQTKINYYIIGLTRISRAADGTPTLVPIHEDFPDKKQRGDVLDVEEAVARIGRDGEILTLYAEGWTCLEIGGKYGISESRVVALVKRARAKVGRRLGGDVLKTCHRSRVDCGTKKNNNS